MSHEPAISIQAAHAILTAPGAPFEMEEVSIEGKTYRAWRNAPATLVEIFREMQTYTEREYLVYEGERYRYGEIIRAVEHLAQSLQRQYGIRKGDRIAIAMRNYPEWVIAFWAIAVVGGVVVPLNAWGTADELKFGLENSGSRVLFADAERSRRLHGMLPELPRVLARAEIESDANSRTFEDLLGDAENYARLPRVGLPEVALSPEDNASIFYTSGTTGRPKGALGTHRNICTNLLSAGFAAARGLLRRGDPFPDPDVEAPQKTALLTVPLFHVTGCHSTLIPVSRTGGRLVLMYKWDAGKALELIEQEGINGIGGVPTMMWQLIEHPDFQKRDTSSIETIGYGGAAAAPELVSRLKQAFPQVPGPGQGYGMTETSSIVTSNSAEDYLRKPDSCGPAIPVCDIRVVDEQGQDVAPGEIGELWVRGPNIIKGYWQRPEATAEALTDGFMHTGDLVTVDEEGFVTVADRAKDMLIRGGENIYCAEVEAALYTHPEVVEAAVVGIPQKVLGEEVAAVVTVRPGSKVTELGLRKHVGEVLASFKVPVVIDIRSEELPKNANGKVLKNVLREEVLSLRA